MANPTKFTVSYTALQRAKECPRADYHKRFTSDKGWYETSAIEKRLAYAGKKTQGYYGWIGDKVHSAIESYFERSECGKKSPRVAGIITETLKQMDKDWSESISWSDSLVEHHEEYGDVFFYQKGIFFLSEHIKKNLRFLDPEMLKKAKDQVKFCLNTFNGSEIRKNILKDDSFRSGLAKFEVLDEFRFDGYSVWVKADVILFNGAGAHIIDWKTGKRQPSHNEQLAIYGKYLFAKQFIKPEAVTVTDVYLKEPNNLLQQSKLEDVHLRQLDISLTQGLAEMRKLMIDMPANKPKPIEKWRQNGVSPDDEVCKWCPYTKLCWKKDAR